MNRNYKPLTAFSLSMLLGLPCYAESPGAMTGMLLIFLLWVVLCGIILGFITKFVLYNLRLQYPNWLIFTTSILLCLIIWICILK